MLEKDPALRQQNYEEVIEQLQYAYEELIKKRSLTGERKLPADPLEPKPRSRRGVWVAAATLLIAASIMAGGKALSPRSQTRSAVTETQALERVAKPAEAFAELNPAKLPLQRKKQFEKARQLLIEGDRGALAAFQALENEPGITPVEQSWMIFNEGLSALRTGDLESSRVRFGTLATRNSKEASLVEKFFFDSGTLLANYKTITPADLTDPNPNGVKILPLLAYGLKDMALGAADDGADLLKQFRAAVPSGNASWVSRYQEIAQPYLLDYQSYHQAMQVMNSGSLDDLISLHAKIPQFSEKTHMSEQVEALMTKRLASFESGCVAAANLKDGDPAPPDLVSDLDAMRKLGSDRMDVFQTLATLNLGDSAQSLELHRAAIAALASAKSAEAVPIIAKLWPKLPKTIRIDALDYLTASQARAIEVAKTARSNIEFKILDDIDDAALYNLNSAAGNGDTDAAALVSEINGRSRPLAGLTGGRLSDHGDVNHSTLNVFDYLLPGQFLVSPNGLNILVQNSDGNLAIYRGSDLQHKGELVWESGVHKASGEYFSRFQDDGNFVTYMGAPAPRGEVQREMPVWNTATYGKSADRLLLTDAPQLAILSGPAVVFSLPASAKLQADDSFETSWKRAAGSPEKLAGLLFSNQYTADPQLRRTVHEYALQSLAKLPPELSALTENAGPSGRYVRIELPHKGVLTLAEVQVFSSGTNIALQGSATQSSVFLSGEAKRAIDGNTDGRYLGGSETHTAEDDDHPWWEVDLGKEHRIDSITIWNRTEANGAYARRLDGFTLAVLDTNRREVFKRSDMPAPNPCLTIQTGSDRIGAFKRAAISAASVSGGDSGPLFHILAGFIAQGELIQASIDAIRTFPRSAWNSVQAQSDDAALANALVNEAASVPAPGRAAPEYARMVQLASDLAGVLPAKESASIRKALHELRMPIFVVKALRGQMRYDTTRIIAEPGKTLQVIVQNDDDIPHNFVVVKSGSHENAGRAATSIQPSQLDKSGRAYIPDIPEILAGTKLIDPGQRQILQINGMKEEGEYEFVCTVPGHYASMWGRLIVTKDVDAWLEKHPEPAGK